MRLDRRLLVGFAAFWFICAVLAILAFNASVSLGTVRLGDPMSLWRRTTMQAAPWLTVLLLTPVVLALCGRLPISRETWRRAVLVHGGTLVLFALAHSWLSTVLLFLIRAEAPRWPTFASLIGRVAVSALVIVTEYALIVGAAEAMRYAREASERAAQAERLARQSAELERDLNVARLAALRQQLQPHFLFNALNAVTSLIDERPADAQRLVTRLSDLLRLSLDRIAAADVSFGEELDLTDRYIEVERARFGDRLQVRYDVDDATLGARVPSFILQPLVENAVRHGVGRRTAGGTVAIAARREGDKLRVSIRNDMTQDSPAPVSHAALTGGLGLPQTRARLDGLYGAEASLRAGPDGADHFLATLTLPWKAVDSAAM